jgi:2-haloacid dehalogenase
VRESYRPAIESVVFDIGGVLLDWNPRHLYRQVFDDEAAMEYFLGHICTPSWHDDHDRGASTVESCARLAATHPEHADEIWAWARRGEEMVSGVLVENVDLLAELTEAGVACFALSNMEAETFPLRFEQFAFFRLFSGIVISGMEQMAKPDREIYELLLDRFGLQSESTLYIDDNAGNLEPASALGMSTVHYRSPESLRRSLVDAGLPLQLPAGRNPDGGGHLPG